MTEAMKPVELTVADTNTATWELFPVADIGANLEHVPLMEDCTFLFITTSRSTSTSSATRTTRPRRRFSGG